MKRVIPENVAFVFPGQGSQKVGMGRAWAESHAEARAVFEEADERLGFALSKLCWEGPEAELQRTANTQPALLTVSVAILRVLEAAGARPAAVAGHSLGEYSALVAAGVLDFGDAVALVRRRGELMQQAVPEGVGAMAAILGLDAAALEEVVAEVCAVAQPAETAVAASAAAGDGGREVCAIANLNAPGQTVIAGHAAAVDRAVAAASERGAKKAVRLPVSAPFHSPLMRPAREGMAPLLAATIFRDPRCPVYVNADAAPVTSGEAARDALVRQIDSPVRWVESVEQMAADGIGVFVEVGPGKVLCGLIRRIAAGSVQAGLAEPDSLPELLDQHWQPAQGE